MQKLLRLGLQFVQQVKLEDQKVSHGYKISQEKVTWVYMAVKKKTFMYYEYQYYNKEHDEMRKLH